MASWKEFAAACPDLAAAGERLLYQYGVGLGFLATVRKDGGPRIHPVCPFLESGHLYVLVVPDSPKKDDLVRDGRYALHTFPPEREDEEFYCTGQAECITDHERRARAISAAKHIVRETEVLFELMIERVLHTTWENWATPQTRPIYTKWRETESVQRTG